MDLPQNIHLPTEIVVQIVTIAAGDDHQRQSTLYACCLVSRQWYSASIALLYESPQIDAGNSFQKFAATISPPIGVRKSKWNLGSLVRRLDMSSLVHHSSNSLTARLLGRIKENLEIFIAPRFSFSSNSLPALSKCANLYYLDLSLVADPIPFSNLRRALSKLTKVLTLRLPQSTNISSHESSSIPWPPHIRRLQLSGRFSTHIMPAFTWPPSLTSLTLRNCYNLSVTNISALISNPGLSQTLKRLTIAETNRSLSPDSINAILAFLPSLSYLSIPGDMVDHTFFDLLDHVNCPNLEVLEFGLPCMDPLLHFETESLLRALPHGLPNLRCIGFAEVFCSDNRMIDDDELDEILLKRAEEKIKLLQQGDTISNSFPHFPPGVYYV